jgi:hypothetical protein
MPAGSMQLHAIGAQNEYINYTDHLKPDSHIMPDISYFKAVYHKTVNFAIEQYEHIIENPISVDEWKGRVTLGSNNGDLVSDIALYIEFTVGASMSGTGVDTNYFSFTNSTGHAYIKDYTLLIGSIPITKHFSEWLDIYNELTDYKKTGWTGINKHAGKSVYYKSVKNIYADELDRRRYLIADDKLTCYVPLPLPLTTTGAFLPLIALYNTRVELQFTFRRLSAIFNSNSTFSKPAIKPNVTLLVDYILLDDKTRRIFRDDRHQYVIEQVQRIDPQQFENTHTLTFNHPIKEVIWVIRNKNAGTECADPAAISAQTDATLNVSSATPGYSASWKYNDYFNYSCASRQYSETVGGLTSFEPFEYATILFDGVERITRRKPAYFRIYQPSLYHSNPPMKHIYLYSFSRDPENSKAYGTANLSMIQKFQIQFTNIITDHTEYELIPFAINYNVLCCLNGQAGVRFKT